MDKEKQDNFTLCESITDFLKNDHELRDLDIYQISHVSEKILPKPLQGVKWDHTSTILVGEEPGMNLKRIRLGIALKTKGQKRCYSNSIPLCGHYLDVLLRGYFFYHENHLVHLCFCDQKYLSVFVELFNNSAISFSDITVKKGITGIRNDIKIPLGI